MTTLPPTILVVDDDESNLSLLDIVFRNAGYDVLLATEGKTAVSVARSHIAIAFVDIHLPDMPGVEVVTILRQANSQTLIVVATMDDDPKTIKAAFAAGCDVFLVKPYDVMQLLTLARQVQRGPRLIFDRLGQREYQG